jgi:hypothetical protein
MLFNGWEFFILNPLDGDIKQTTQDKYIEMYTKAYNSFLYQLCIPNPNDLLEDNFDFMYYIDISGENDKINLEEKYDYNFLKSVFIDKKFKKLKTDVINYYTLQNIYVKNMYKQDNSFYLLLNKK